MKGLTLIILEIDTLVLNYVHNYDRSSGYLSSRTLGVTLCSPAAVHAGPPGTYLEASSLHTPRPSGVQPFTPALLNHSTGMKTQLSRECKQSIQSLHRSIFKWGDAAKSRSSVQ